MIFDLVQDFVAMLEAMPTDHPRHVILRLLDEAIRRDVHFIDRRPTTLFQCLWNTCWWYDHPDAASHFDLSERTGTGQLPWEREGPKLYPFLEQWRREKEMAD